MDPKYGIKSCINPHHHHHHHFHHHHHHHHNQLFFLPHHHHHHHYHCHRHVFPNCASLPKTLEHLGSHVHIPNNDIVEVSENGGVVVDSSPRVLQEEEDYGLEEEEEDELIFVLTDEWRDFFAKSEAKRKLEKKQAKKGKK